MKKLIEIHTTELGNNEFLVFFEVIAQFYDGTEHIIDRLLSEKEASEEVDRLVECGKNVKYAYYQKRKVWL